jgi:hypothetical protein
MLACAIESLIIRRSFVKIKQCVGVCLKGHQEWNLKLRSKDDSMVCALSE